MKFYCHSIETLNYPIVVVLFVVGYKQVVLSVDEILKGDRSNESSC